MGKKWPDSAAGSWGEGGGEACVPSFSLLHANVWTGVCAAAVLRCDYKAATAGRRDKRFRLKAPGKAAEGVITAGQSSESHVLRRCSIQTQTNSGPQSLALLSASP
ncbi:hypothetical protein AAFF_G00219710 [Aldrovandia affinis]|uniref:Uncharacterized protein n=1 Tax=Aldrovandia affinis TaxID=143900 RepID=A0AAD7RFU9_9TELE|nr:hypothetical protein AAFF_G00219710 [Aldrovandia affinis]